MDFSQPGSGRGWEQLSAGALVAALAVMLEEPSGEPVEKSFFIALVIFAAALIAYQLLAPSPQIENARPAGLSEFTFPTTTQDRTVPIIVGTVRQRGPNVNWYGDLEQRAVIEEISSGFFNSEEVVRGYQYFVGIQFAVCRSGDDATPVELRRIWINEDEVFNGSIAGEGSLTVSEPELFGGQELGQGGVEATVSWRPGTTTQTVNTYLDGTGEQKIPPTTGQTPRYTGLAYAMVEKGYIGNSTTVAPWSFEVRRIPNGLGLASPAINSGNDANPINFAYEILTNQEWGYKFAAADIDTSSFIAAANVMQTEGNGISMIIDAEIDASALLDEVSRQISGVISLDPSTGKWIVKLARDDYDINTIPQLTSPLEVSEYKTGAWDETTNIVTVAFVNRADDYNEDTAPAQNMANALIQGDGTVTGGRAVPGNVRYPGIKSAALADDVAWRELRTRSRPLIQAKVSVTREFWDVTPGSVIAWTDDRHEGLKIPFRITKINYGRLRSGAIVLELVEDVFRYIVGSFGPPQPTKWSPPQGVPAAFPSTEQLAIESPRGISSRASGGLQAYLMCMGRRQNFAAKFQIWQRNDPTTPAGNFTQLGSAFGFMFIGELLNALGEGTAIPTATIDIDPDPDIQADIEAAITDSTDPVNVGTNLLNLLMVGDEFMLAMSAADSGGNVRLTDTYRGVLGSVQGDHAAGAPIYILFGNVSSGAIPETNKCEVKLLPESAFGVVLLASATTITISKPGGTGMDKRNRRPYPPGRISLGGTVYATTTSLEGNGSVPEDFGLDLDYIRRDYRTGDGGDEIAALTTDAATLFPSFPAFNTTTVEVEAIDDPDGTPTSLFTETALTGTGTTVLRIEILAQTDGVLPTRMQLSLIQRHDEGPDTGLASRDAAFHDFDVTTALTGDFNFGARAQAVASNQYTATVNGTYTFNLSTALPGGEDVEYQLNGGGWVQLIAGGGTGPGTIVGVVATDTIDVRHQGTGSPIRKQLTMVAAGAGQDGYFILTG